MSILFFIVPIFIASVFLLVILTVIGSVRVHKAQQKMMNNLSDQSVREYIGVLGRIRLTNNNPTTWDTYRATFELVATSGNVSSEVKRELRNALLKKGVNRLMKI